MSNSTYNLRVAALSRFYRYAQTKDASRANPITQVKRRFTQEYASAQALDEEQVREGLGAINRARLDDLRDFSLLVTLLMTERRASEVASLCLGDLQPTRKGLMLRQGRVAQNAVP